MSRLPWWTAVSATLAPVFLIGGWTLAAARQPAGYDPVRDTISALAALGATDRWIMTTGLAGLGLCHVVTALGLRFAARVGRVVLATGGVATLLVAALPLPHVGPHRVAAGIGFAALALWPALALRRGPTTPWVLRPPAALGASVVLLGLLGWFAVELFGAGARIGLTERFLAGAQALWPLVVVAQSQYVSWRR
jgi:hypothetical membrane protein